METFDAIRTVLAVRHFKILRSLNLSSGTLSKQAVDRQWWQQTTLALHSRTGQGELYAGLVSSHVQGPISRRHRWRLLWLWIAAPCYLRWQSRYPGHDFGSMVARRRLKLGWLQQPAGGQRLFGHSRGGLSARDPSVRLPG